MCCIYSNASNITTAQSDSSNFAGPYVGDNSEVVMVCKWMVRQIQGNQLMVVQVQPD